MLSGKQEEDEMSMPVWIYKDARGVEQRGVYAGSHSTQGTDITYFFKRDDGTTDFVSGQRLKEARVESK